MIYVMSDLHGCFTAYRRMLERISFGPKDTLYLLGDVVDRGPDGVKLLQDMLQRPNVIPLLGNHECLALQFLPIALQPPAMQRLLLQREPCKRWLEDGGQPTFDAFAELETAEQQRLLAYLNTFLPYEEVEINGSRFFLSHTVPEKEKMQKLSVMPWQELVWGEPEYEKVYFPDRYLVTGHTPTGTIDPSCAGKIYRKNRHIAMDCGAVFGQALGCIRLDDGQEYYMHERR